MAVVSELRRKYEREMEQVLAGNDNIQILIHLEKNEKFNIQILAQVCHRGSSPNSFDGILSGGYRLDFDCQIRPMGDCFS